MAAAVRAARNRHWQEDYGERIEAFTAWFEENGLPLIMATQLAGTIDRREPGGWVAAFASDRDRQAIQRALDALLSQA